MQSKLKQFRSLVGQILRFLSLQVHDLFSSLFTMELVLAQGCYDV